MNSDKIKRGAFVLLVVLALFGILYGGGNGSITGFAVKEQKNIDLILEYGSGIYDEDNDGREAITGAIDFTVENTEFNWNITPGNLCTRWEIYSLDDETLTIVCHGSSNCCALIELAPRRDLWNEPFFLTFGQFGSGFSNIISSQVIYSKYNISPEAPEAEILYSGLSNLSAEFFIDKTPFQDVCVDTCSLKPFNTSELKLIVEINNARLSINSIAYSIKKPPRKIITDVKAKDSKGIIRADYRVLKDGQQINETFIEEGVYDIEIIPEDRVIEKLVIEKVNYTEPIIIGIDSIEKSIQIETLDVKKKFAIDISSIEFESAVFSSIASAEALYKCGLWDFKDEVCFREWEEIMNLTPGEKYGISLTKGNVAFAEADFSDIKKNASERALEKTTSKEEKRGTRKVGELCALSEECEIGFCLPPTEGGNWKCAEESDAYQKENGEECKVNTECKSNYCLPSPKIGVKWRCVDQTQ